MGTQNMGQKPMQQTSGDKYKDKDASLGRKDAGVGIDPRKQQSGHGLDQNKDKRHASDKSSEK